MRAICDVCYILDKDDKPKLVYYCDKCNAWICVECEPNLLRRGLAMIKSKLKTK